MSLPLSRPTHAGLVLEHNSLDLQPAAAPDPEQTDHAQDDDLRPQAEPGTRGPYSGSLGYLGFNRESQFNIAIRTAIIRDGQVHYQAGAGIVADSDPEMEYEETLAKARGFVKALSFTTEAQRAQRETDSISL